MNDYAELHCLSDFSFQRGAASASQLFQRARECGYDALAITDECSMAGIVRAHEAAKRAELKLIIGTEITLAAGVKVVPVSYTHLDVYKRQMQSTARSWWRA